ncbi:hypothetical protein Tco_1436159 [Tanacetum coccineum]
MPTPVFVDLEISTQANGAQSSRVPVPLHEDPYEAIRQAYLVGTDTESEPFEDPVETEAPESPHTVAPPTSLPDSTPPILVPILRRIARMAVRVPHAMSPGLSASIPEVAAMSDSAFLEDNDEEEDDEEGDDDEEDEEIEESLDSDRVSEDAEDEGPTAEDEDPATGDEGLAAGDEGPGMRVESLSLGGDKVVPGGQQQAAPVVETTVGEPLGLGYGVLRRWEIALGEDRMPSVFEVAPSIVPLPISSPMIPLTVPSLVASPATAETEGFLTELGARVEMQGGLICDHMVRLGELSPALFKRSLDHEQERVAVTFGVIWRPMENQELRLQIAKERHARLDLAEVINSMRRGQDPRGDV